MMTPEKMAEAEMQTIVLRLPALSLRDQLDVDSMDFLNFVIALDTELHIAVPETDYAKVATPHDGISDLQQRSQ